MMPAPIPREDPLSTHSSVAEKKSAHTYRTPVWYWILVGVLVAVIAFTAVPALTGEVHSPGIEDFFPEAIFGEGTLFQFSRITLARFIVVAVLVLVFGSVAARMKLVPGRGQAVIELGAEFVRKNIGVDMLGNKFGRRFAPVIGAIFFGVLCMNITGVVPGINIAASSVVAVPLVFAVVSYVTYIGAGIKVQGVGHFFKSQLFPPGLPWPIYFLITPIEAFSTFIIRPATLVIRLLCNMISGHLLLAVTYFGTATLLSAMGAMKGLALLTGVAAMVITLFEIFVACLQAYVFAVLTAVYIKLSVESH